eukprot:764771-Rhodomonas_salina.1
MRAIHPVLKHTNVASVEDGMPSVECVVIQRNNHHRWVRDNAADVRRIEGKHVRSACWQPQVQAPQSFPARKKRSHSSFTGKTELVHSQRRTKAVWNCVTVTKSAWIEGEGQIACI